MTSEMNEISPFPRVTSPGSKRNTKNLSLQLKSPHTNAISDKQHNSNDNLNSIGINMSSGSVPSPQQGQSVGAGATACASSLKSPASISHFTDTSHTRLYRHPSLSKVHSSQENGGTMSRSLSRRRTTAAGIAPLSLSIPTDTETCKPSSLSLSSSSMSSSSTKLSSSSPISSSPIMISNTPLFSKNSSSNSVKTLQYDESPTPYTNGNCSASASHSTNPSTLKAQTLVSNLSPITGKADEKKSSYPHGPICVFKPNLYLYSEPTLSQIDSFDVIINVAKELPQLTPSNSDKTKYYYIPWTHTSKICKDLPKLIGLIEENLALNKKILIHCQCGVSRSASLIVAFFMKYNHSNLNDSYNLLKLNAPDISPNMSLIFQLMEWGEIIGVN